MNAAPRTLVTAAWMTALFTAAFLVSLVVTAPAHAQGGWNRQVDAVSIHEDPTGSGQYEVHAVWRALLDTSPSVPLDLSTEVDLLVNGTVAATVPHTLGVDPGTSSCTDGSFCSGSCGSGTLDGAAATLVCQADGPCNPVCDCKCGFLPISTPFTPMTLRPEDEIMVLLRPAPGALPDPDTSDDQKLFVFDGDEIFWDHQLTSLTLTPSSTGPNRVDVVAEGTIFYEGVLKFAGTGTPVPLDMSVDLLVNGVAHSSIPVPFQPEPLGFTCTCGVTACGSYGGTPHFCVLGAGPGCNCGWPWLEAFPGVEVLPGDVITVILRPVPGALPELPGFDEDEELDEIVPSPTGVEEVASLADAVQLQQNQPNPFQRGTTIAFSTAGATPVRLDVFDVAGRHVRTLMDRRVESAGNWSENWNGRTDQGQVAPAGIYFYRLTAHGQSQTRKMTYTN
ncbi:MAG: hypothetical protein DHS20C21_21390 [Gemmatimonadota bacterium]|nr:MAG: hypothetical protein DHS20C21_21390 [Gemmatimonadota bacterium]